MTVHYCTPFGIAIRGKATLNVLLAIDIPYSGNANVRYDIMFSLAPWIFFILVWPTCRTPAIGGLIVCVCVSE